MLLQLKITWLKDNGLGTLRVVFAQLMSQLHIYFLSVLLPFICGVWSVLPLERTLDLFVLLSSFLGLLVISPLGQTCMLWALLPFAEQFGKLGTERALRKSLSPLQWS